MDFSHGIRVSEILLAPFRRIEMFDIAHRHGVDERTFLGICVMAGEVARFLYCRKRKRRLIGLHWPVQKRSPGPGFTPVTDRAIRIALLSFTKRPDRIDFIECVFELKALVEICPSFSI